MGRLDEGSVARRKLAAAKSSALAAMFADTREGEAFNWLGCDAALLKRAIHVWTSQGNAITLGLTSDGGCVAITLLAGGERFKLYAKDGDELEAQLKRIAGI